MPKLFTASEEEPTRKVLRIQHKDTGYGPYTAGNEHVEAIMSASGLQPPQTSTGWSHEDLVHLEDPSVPKKFGFLSEEQMVNSIGKDRLAQLKQHGFEPKWIDADHIWHGDGKQIFFSTPDQSAKKQQNIANLKQKTKYKEFSPKEITAINQSKIKKNLEQIKSLLQKSMMNAGIGGPGSVKRGAMLPSRPKSFKLPGSTNSATPSLGIPAPKSKKNPIKVAEQIQNPDIKDMKMKEAQSALNVNKSEEVIKLNTNGQWSLEKSNYKGYTEADNVRRKANNIGVDTGIKTMNRIKQYGGSGANAAEREAKQMRAKSKKNPVKEFSPEEIEAFNIERGFKKH